jgi:hypothetical protein
MRRAIDETIRRRKVQEAYNEEMGITPETVRKAVRELLLSHETATHVAETRADYAAKLEEEFSDQADLPKTIESLQKRMREAARELQFEEAAAIRDRIKALEAMRDGTLPQADLNAELWGRRKPRRYSADGEGTAEGEGDGAREKPALFTKNTVSGGGRNRHSGKRRR